MSGTSAALSRSTGGSPQMNSLTPQQPAWISASTADAGLRTQAFIRRVYAWMFGGLLVTALASVWVIASPAMQALVLGNPVVTIGLIIAEIGIVIFLSFRL